jgi:hypothetical protein
LPDGEVAIDPRFKYVTRGIATYWEQLAGRWAVPGFEGSDAEASMKAGTTYGQKIDKIYESLLATAITDVDINEYFIEIEEEPVPEVPVELEDQENNEELDVAKVNFILDLLEKVLKAILNLFSRN